MPVRRPRVGAFAFFSCLAAGSVGLAAAAPSAVPSAFSIARLKYGGGGDWYGDQTSLRNLLAATRDRLGVPVAADEEAVVSPLDEALFRQARFVEHAYWWRST